MLTLIDANVSMLAKTASCPKPGGKHTQGGGNVNVKYGPSTHYKKMK